MAEALEQRGHEAFVDEDFQQALDLYSQAVALDGSNPSPLISRAQAHIKLGHFTDAIADTKRAIELNPSLPKAYLRKGIACFSLEEYETAKAAFEKGAELENSLTFRSWINKCNEKLSEESAGKSSEAQETQAVSVNGKDADVVMTPAVEPSTLPPSPPPPRYRHEWYQSQVAVVVTIFAKGVKPDDIKVDFGEQTLRAVISVPNEEPYVLQIRLFGKVDVSQCKCTVLSTKVEIRLTKAEDIHWIGLEYENRQKVLPKPSDLPIEAPKYPSSSKKSVTKNWDMLEAEIKKEEKDEKLEGDAALNKLFREIYSNADEETRRAMNKSFVESNGTVLSTNWAEVGTKKVEGSAPQGMEMKKWEI